MYKNEGKQVIHTNDGVEHTHIADAGDVEKAHFLAAAANAFSVIENIGGWAEARNLVRGSNPQAQTVKLFEEGGELAGGVAKHNLPAIEDSVGDMVVVLVILCLQTGLNFHAAVDAAYNTIKNRKGVMRDGVFIKDE